MSFADFLRFHWIQDPADGRAGGLAPVIPIPVPVVPPPVQANAFPEVPALIPQANPLRIEEQQWREPRNDFENVNDDAEKKKKHISDQKRFKDWAVASLKSKQKAEENAKWRKSNGEYSPLPDTGINGDDEASLWSDVESESENQKLEEDSKMDMYDDDLTAFVKLEAVEKLERYKTPSGEITSDAILSNPVNDWVKKRNDATAARLAREDHRNGWNSSMHSTNSEVFNVSKVKLKETKMIKDAKKSFLSALENTTKNIHSTQTAENMRNLPEGIKYRSAAEALKVFESLAAEKFKNAPQLAQNDGLSEGKDSLDSSIESDNIFESFSAIPNKDNIGIQSDNEIARDNLEQALTPFVSEGEYPHDSSTLLENMEKENPTAKHFGIKELWNEKLEADKKVEADFGEGFYFIDNPDQSNDIDLPDISSESDESWSDEDEQEDEEEFLREEADDLLDALDAQGADVEIHVALDELIGIHANRPWHIMFRNVLWLITFNCAFLGLFLALPCTIGSRVIHFLSILIPKGFLSPLSADKIIDPALSDFTHDISSKSVTMGTFVYVMSLSGRTMKSVISAALPLKGLRNVSNLVTLIIDKSSKSGSALEILDVCLLCVGYAFLFGMIFLMYQLSQFARRATLSRRAVSSILEPIKSLAAVAKVGVFLMIFTV